jgi:hypothetical protein
MKARQEAQMEDQPEVEVQQFDPRTEVSADAKKIVRTLWTIFVVLPVLVAILYALVNAR